MNNIPGHVRPGGTSYVSPEGIIYCTDGKLRWVYEIDQRRKPTVLLQLLGKYVGLCAVVGALIMLVQGGTGGAPALLGSLPVVLCLLAAGALLAAVSYATHRLQNGPFVCFVFTTDEGMISRQQVKGKANKEKVTRAFAAWVGGQSQPAVRVCSLREVSFGDVHAVKVQPKKQRIRLRGKKSLTVHAEAQQFQPVLDYLMEHCPQVK